MIQQTLEVGLVGLGEMGMPIAKRLTAAGYRLHVYVRRPEARATVAGLGAVIDGSLHDLAAVSDVVIICVYSDDQVREVALGSEGLIAHARAGGVIVNHTTGRPATAEALAVAAGERSCSMLDAALSGGPPDIAAGNLTLLVGGDADILERVRPVLASYSSPIVSVGTIGDGQRVKLLNNTLFGAHVALTRRVEECAIELGMDPGLTLAAIRECSGDSYVVRTALGAGSAERLVELAGRFIRKDIAVAAEIAEELSVDLGPLLGVAQTV